MRASSEPAQSHEPSTSNAEERLRLALAAGRMGTWELALDQDPPLVLSPELQTILGLASAQFDGTIKAFLARVEPGDRSQLVRRLRKTIRDITDPEIEFRFAGNNGSQGWLLGRGKIYRDADGRPCRLVGVGIDVTAQKRAELEVLRLNAELERRVAERTTQLQATNKELEAFCYSVSHDLRAPLRSIRGFNEVLLERYGPSLDAKAQEFLRRACESSQYMDGLIDSLLKLSRVGRSELTRQQVNLSNLATGIAVELSSAEPERNVVFDIMPGLITVGDEHLIRIVLDNLLRNAWKFTSRRPTGHIQFGLTPTHESVFFVRDDGAGFDPAYVDRLFGVFQRLHPSSEFPGHGVGLATVQRIINRHGGRVWASGAVDNGATFFFSLPRNETT